MMTRMNDVEYFDYLVAKFTAAQMASSGYVTVTKAMDAADTVVAARNVRIKNVAKAKRQTEIDRTVKHLTES